MFDSIPLQYYTPVFYNFILIFVLVTFMRLQTKGYVIYNPLKKEYTSLLLLVAVVLYMGLRPISGRYFIDMGIYNYAFEYYAGGGEVLKSRDILWNVFMKFCSTIMNAKMFFLLCAFLYVLPLYSASKKWLGEDKYFLFLMLIASLSFWPYGVNGIRNGIATSFFIYGLSLTKNSYIKYGILALSYSVHGSMIIPLAAYFITMWYNNTIHYLFAWFLSISVSLIFGNYLELFISSIGIGGSRLQYLTMNDFDEQFSSIGFRWDFLLYSACAVYAGYHFIIKKKFNDPVYIQLVNIYIIANTFWVLVIRASFSNRFAYLSWFLMAVIIFYPFFKKQFFRKQQKVLAFSVLVYFGFTYIIFIVSQILTK